MPRRAVLGPLLDSPLVTRAGLRGLVASVAHHALCLQPLDGLLIGAARYQDQIDNDVQPRVEMTMPSTGEDRRLTAQGSIDRADRLDLADALMAVLESKLSHRTIRSFFTVEVASNGYRLWNPHLRAPKDSGSALVRHSIQTDAGHVSVDMMRYADEEQTHVRAYEWCAELREDGSSELPDAEALIDAGDLAFVWLWERRSGTRPGAGQACLRAALTDLRRRQRRIRTVIVDLKPYPYVVSDSAGTPATVHIEKLEAMDRLQAFVDELQLDRLIKGHYRSLVNRDSDDANAAMRVLGLAGLEQQNSPRQDGG